jgi:hypothetical protein
MAGLSTTIPGSNMTFSSPRQRAAPPDPQCHTGEKVAASRGIRDVARETRRATTRRAGSRGPAETPSDNTTDNSPQTNHIKNISTVFLSNGETLSVRGLSADAVRQGAPASPVRVLARRTLRCVCDFATGEIVAAPARQVMRTRMVEVGDA